VEFVPPRVTPAPGPLGRLRFIATFVRNPLEVLPRAVYERDMQRYGSRVYVTAPALIKEVLLDRRESFHKLAQIRFLGPLLGAGLLTSEGRDWKWQRQAAAPMFRREDLLRFAPVFARAALEVLAAWGKAPAHSVQRIDRDMTRATFAVISATLLPSADDTVGPVLERSVDVFQRSAGWGILFASAGVPGWMPRPGFLSGLGAISRLRRAVAALVRERRASRTEPDDLMHHLMVARDPESGRSMNDQQLVDNLLTFYLAGHETTARALTWTLYLLACSPQWGAALRDEIARVTAGAPVRGEHIERLVLVQQVLKEAMRLYPPVPIMSRQAIGDTTLGGERIAAGSSVVIPIYAVHRHAARWAEPDAFDPARFAPAAEASIARYQYMPFGAGPRICIGMAFAMVEATAILATLLRRADFSVPEGEAPYPVAKVTLVPRGGLRLRVSLRQGLR
jgi:cytochrome P450